MIYNNKDNHGTVIWLNDSLDVSQSVICKTYITGNDHKLWDKYRYPDKSVH